MPTHYKKLVHVAAAWLQGEYERGRKLGVPIGTADLEPLMDTKIILLAAQN